MRALTMDEVGHVSGGGINDNDWDLPTYVPNYIITQAGWESGYEPTVIRDGDNEGFSQEGGGSATKRSAGDYVKGFLYSLFGASLGISWVNNTSDGTKSGVCLDKRGNVIRNANGDPLLACSSTAGSISIFWGN